MLTAIVVTVCHIAGGCREIVAAQQDMPACIISQPAVADWKEPYCKGVVYYLRDGRVRGVLLWNVAYATNRNVGVGETEEIYEVEAVDGSPNSVRVKAFGRTEIFDNITKITGDFGSDDDKFRVVPGLVMPMQIRGGAGNDQLEVFGSATTEIYGDDGADKRPDRRAIP